LTSFNYSSIVNVDENNVESVESPIVYESGQDGKVVVKIGKMKNAVVAPAYTA
jgi:hypothetical protein